MKMKIREIDYGKDRKSIQENAHDSLGDCYATLHCYNKMKEGCLK